jgi:hypothetical protein
LPRFVPTDEQRKIVEKAAGFGLPQEKICQLVISERTGKPIDKKTLAEAFRAELGRGMAVTDSRVSGSAGAQVRAYRATPWFDYSSDRLRPACVRADSLKSQFDPIQS